MTTALYERTMQFSRDEMSRDRGELMQEVWSKTPWMVDTYTGGCNEERSTVMQQWCRDTFGPECWPIHGHQGDWQRGGVTVFGWTWYGFASEQQMQMFISKWPTPEKMAA